MVDVSWTFWQKALTVIQCPKQKLSERWKGKLLSKPAGVTTTNIEEQAQQTEWCLGSCSLTWMQPGISIRNSFPWGGTTLQAWRSPPPGLVQTLNREGSTFLLCLSSSAKTKMMKNYCVYAVKSYTTMCNSVHQENRKKKSQTQIWNARRIWDFWTFKGLISQLLKRTLIQTKDFCMQFFNEQGILFIGKWDRLICGLDFVSSQQEEGKWRAGLSHYYWLTPQATTLKWTLYEDLS